METIPTLFWEDTCEIELKEGVCEGPYEWAADGLQIVVSNPVAVYFLLPDSLASDDTMRCRRRFVMILSIALLALAMPAFPAIPPRPPIRSTRGLIQSPSHLLHLS